VFFYFIEWNEKDQKTRDFATIQAPELNVHYIVLNQQDFVQFSKKKLDGSVTLFSLTASGIERHDQILKVALKR